MRSLWIVGLGYWANILVPKIEKVFQDYNLEFVDIDTTLKIPGSHHFSKKIFDFKSFIQKAHADDICFVLTPPITHFEIIKFVLEKKLHTWSEKPLCMDLSQAKQLVDMAMKNNVCLFVDDTFLYDSNIQKLKNLLEKEKIVSITSYRHGWGRVLKDGGILWDLLPHDLSILTFIGQKLEYLEINSNWGNFQNFNLNEKLELQLFGKTASGVSIQISLSYVEKNKVRNLRIQTEKNYYFYKSLGNQSELIVSDLKIPPIQNIVSDKLIGVSKTEPLLNALKNFKVLIGNKSLQPTLFDHLRNINLIKNLF